MSLRHTLPALALLAFACSKPTDISDSSGPGEPAPDAADAPGARLDAPEAKLELASAVGGREIRSQTDGPWTVRSDSRRSDSRRSDSRRSDSRRSGSGDAVEATREFSARSTTGGVSRRFHARSGGLPAAGGPAGSVPAPGSAPAAEGVDSSRSARDVPEALYSTDGRADRELESTALLELDSAKTGDSLWKKDLGIAEAASTAPGIPLLKKTSDDKLASSEPARRTSGPPLRAGSTDDNADFDKFLAYIRETRGQQHLSKRYDEIDVGDRRFIRVLDGAGKPLPGAEVLVVDETNDRIVATTRSYGDGRAPFYPSAVDKFVPVAAAGDVENAPKLEPLPTSYVVQVRHGDAYRQISWDGVGDEVVIKLEDKSHGASEVQLDVVFLIDTTGSMGDEIARIKDSLLSVTKRVRSLEKEFDLRYGAVLYRDLGDEYVTKAHPFTTDIAAFDTALKTVRAAGGGDGPESLNQGLAVAVDQMKWRDDAAKIVFLIADAPPHMDYKDDTSYAQSVRVATAKGIKVHAVAASGLDAAGTVVFRQVAQFTRGKFIFIEYGGSVARTAASHGVKGKVGGNNLDEILYEQIRDELAGWGRDV